MVSESFEFGSDCDESVDGEVALNLKDMMAVPLMRFYCKRNLFKFRCLRSYSSFCKQKDPLINHHVRMRVRQRQKTHWR